MGMRLPCAPTLQIHLIKIVIELIAKANIQLFGPWYNLHRGLGLESYLLKVIPYSYQLLIKKYGPTTTFLK